MLTAETLLELACRMEQRGDHVSAARTLLAAIDAERTAGSLACRMAPPLASRKGWLTFA